MTTNHFNNLISQWINTPHLRGRPEALTLPESFGATNAGAVAVGGFQVFAGVAVVAAGASAGGTVATAAGACALGSTAVGGFL